MSAPDPTLPETKSRVMLMDLLRASLALERAKKWRKDNDVNTRKTESAGLPLWTPIRDPMVRAAFRRAERDLGLAFAVPRDPPRTLDGGAEAVPESEVTP
jgi:hypothetical protein